MSLCLTSVKSLYASVIDGVIGGVREYFLDEGVDEQVLMELKHIWETRLKATKAIEVKPEKEPQPPPLKTTTPASGAGRTMLSQFLAAGGQTTLPTEIATKTVSIQITLPAQQGVADSQPRSITIQVPATALQDNQLQTILTGPIISAAMALPQPLATSLLQQHVTTALSGQATVIQQQPIQQTQTTNGQTVDGLTGQQFVSQPSSGIRQLDGQNDTSDDDDEDDDNDEEENDDDDDDDADDKEDEENDENDGGIEEEPLNSGDDVSEEDPSDMFDTDNVVVCQYDKITRTRNKWKFYLKDGIMNLGGKDYVFQKSNGDAEW